MADAPAREDLMKAGIAIQTVALFVATAAHAVTLGTPPLHPDAGGKLSCTVVNVSTRQLGIVARIVSDSGENVTDFASSQYQDPNDEILASVVVESTAGSARYCRIEVSGGGRAHVRASLEAFDADGKRTAVVEAR
jgi:hypothetical protein